MTQLIRRPAARASTAVTSAEQQPASQSAPQQTPTAPQPVSGAARHATEVLESLNVPNLLGDLDVMLTAAPTFRWRRHGYSSVEVDNYVAWLLDELRAARRSVQAMMRSLAEIAGQSAAQQVELDSLHSQLATEGQPIPAWVSDRVRGILQLAVEEAEMLRASAHEAAEEIRADARTHAEAELAAARAEIAALREAARTERERLDAEAKQQRDRARAELVAQGQAAQAERERLDAEAKQNRERARAETMHRIEDAERVAGAKLSAIDKQVTDLVCRRDRTVHALRRVAESIAPLVSEEFTASQKG